MNRYTLVLHGAGLGGLSATLLRDLLDALTASVTAAVRMRLLGRVTPAPSDPNWIVSAAGFAVARFLDPSAGIELAAVPLDVVLPPHVLHAARLTGEETSLSLWSAAARVLMRARDDDDADVDLLAAFERFASVFDGGARSLDLVDAAARDRRLVLTPECMTQLGRLRARMPVPHAARVAGTVEPACYAGPGFTLRLRFGHALPCVAWHADTPVFAAGSAVLVSGMAHFRPSGEALRIDAEYVGPATESELDFWSVTPQPDRYGFEPRELHQPQTRKTGIAAIIGMWPGDESDDEVFAYIEEIS